jgi:hypothetical protein
MTSILLYSISIFKNVAASFFKAPLILKIIKLLIAFWMFFAGIHVYFYYIVGLTIIDVITGVIASIKRGEPFKSKILRKGLIEKGILYNLLMISVFFLEMILKTVISYDAFYLVLASAMMIGTYELSSIAENLIVINPRIAFLKSILKMSNKMHEKTIEIAEKKIDDFTDLPKEKE